MRTPSLAFLLLTMVPATCQAPAPQPVSIAPGLAALHLAKSVAPVYPAIAQLARVTGEVKVRIVIGTDGHIIEAHPVSGPPMLIGAALESAKQSIFVPFLQDGKPVPVVTTLTVSFSLGAVPKPSDQKIADAFSPLGTACSKAVSANADTAQQADLCKRAADVADTFGPDGHFVERRSAFVYASTAFRRDKQIQEALVFAQKAVTVVEQGHDDGSGSSAAYSVRAQAEADLGNLDKASDDLTKAEDFERTAITRMGGFDESFVKREYIPILKGLLNFHAQVLNATGAAEQAQKKLDEAATL